MDGIIIVNKPKGITSHDVVYKVKKIFNKKVGHTGTLDPMATGVLPLLIGKGTLCSKYLINHDKIYNVTLELGKKTDTADAEGNIVGEKEVDYETLKIETVKKTLNQFIGKQKQLPPMYSAIKIKGKKLYEYARKGIQVKVEPREIEIYDIKLNEIDKDKKQIKFTVKCSKGTYIRSLCEDLASKLGTYGFMTELERVQVGNFKLSQSITIEKLEKIYNSKKDLETFKSDFSKSFIDIEKLFQNEPLIELQENKYKHFINGVKLTQKNKKDGVYRIYLNKKFIGTGIVEQELLKRDIVL